MRSLLFAAACLVLSALVALAVGRAASPGAGPAGPFTAPPVLVELFTSEGCSSCPPADRLLEDLVEAGGVGEVPVIALSEHVDYWNRLGWKDPFSHRRFTARQQEYARALDADVYTPQMVVDGVEVLIGSDRAAARAAIQRAAGASKIAVTLSVEDRGKRLVVAASPVPDRAAPLDVFVAVTEDGLETAVARGENAGRRLSHAAVARRLERAGTWASPATAPLRITVPIAADASWQASRTRVVAWLQDPATRRVAGAATSSYEDPATTRID